MHGYTLNISQHFWYKASIPYHYYLSGAQAWGRGTSKGHKGQSIEPFRTPLTQDQRCTCTHYNSTHGSMLMSKYTSCDIFMISHWKNRILQIMETKSPKRYTIFCLGVFRNQLYTGQIWKYHLVSEFHINSLSWVQEEEEKPQTAFPILFTWTSHIATGMLMGWWTAPDQSNGYYIWIFWIWRLNYLIINSVS